MGIFDRFKAAKTGADWAATLAAAQARLADHDDTIAQLKGARSAAIEAGDDARVTKLRSEIATAESIREELVEAASIAERRKAEAEIAERTADQERRAAAGPKLVERIVALRRELHPQILEVVAKCEAVRQAEHALRTLNSQMEAEGRGDLVSEPPYAQWRETVWKARVLKYQQAGRDVPVNLRDAGSIPILFPEFDLKIAGYAPAPTDTHWLEIVFPDLAEGNNKEKAA